MKWKAVVDTGFAVANDCRLPFCPFHGSDSGTIEDMSTAFQYLDMRCSAVGSDTELK